MTDLPALTQQNKCYDNTRISDYKVCPRSYFIRHVLGWRSAGTGNALIFGSCWHDAQDVMWSYAKKFNPDDLAELAFIAFQKTWEESGLPLDIPLEMEYSYSPRTPSIAREMLINYAHERRKILTECELESVERPFAVPIPGMPGHWYIGRLDKKIRYNIQSLIIEHKSTTAYATVGNFRSDYVESWYMSAQVTGYEFGGIMTFGQVDAVWVDVALVHKKVHDAFKFIPVSHNQTLLEEWLGGTRAWVQQISTEEELFKVEGELKPGMFKKNTESCFGKYGPCPFLDICRSIADPSKLAEVPGGYVHEPWNPFDVLGLDKLIQQTTGEK